MMISLSFHTHAMISVLLLEPTAMKHLLTCNAQHDTKSVSEYAAQILALPEFMMKNVPFNFHHKFSFFNNMLTLCVLCSGKLHENGEGMI